MKLLRNMAFPGKFFAPLLLVVITGCLSSKGPGPAPSFLIIRHINVIDVIKGEVVPDQYVVIRDKKIYFIGPSFSENIPANSIRIDGSGKYLSPGLWDMHFHLCWDNNNDTLLFPVLLKTGITGIRDMGGDLAIQQRFRDRLKKGELTGPEIFGAGPMIDGNPPVYRDFSLPVDDNSRIETVLDSLKNNGAAFFKTYSLIREPQLRAISAYCAKNNTRFAGHLSEYIEPEVSISLGQKSIEHLNRLDDIWKVNKPRLDSIGGLMIAKKTFLCPTLITYYLKTKVRDTTIINKDYSQYITPSLMKEWKTIWAKRLERNTKLSNWKELEETYISQLALTSHLHKMGVMLLAGSDFAGMPFVYPGISLQQELKLLVAAGLSNAEALQTATINPAIYMSGEQLYGSVAVGKYADLLILDKDPLENMDNLTTIRTVIVKGKVVQGKN